jgi:hypothetical protein
MPALDARPGERPRKPRHRASRVATTAASAGLIREEGGRHYRLIWTQRINCTEMFGNFVAEKN